jgi:3-oxoacyl-[acyl-carrier protein] reductase
MVSQTEGDRSFVGARLVVTGASRGIGKAVAKAFAARGARLLLLARSAAVFNTSAEMHGAQDVFSLQCDVSIWEQVHSAVEAAEARWGPADVLVNAAAVLGPTGALWQSDPAEWEGAVRSNLVGTYNVLRATIPSMVRAKRGKIINFAGGGAAYGYPNFSAYGSAKAALVRLSETLALECAPHNIQVNIIAPGAVDTQLLAQVRAAGGEVRTVGRMEDAVALVLYLSSPAADGITGRFIHARDDYHSFAHPLPPDLYTLRRVER